MTQSRLSLNDVEWGEFNFLEIFNEIYIAPSSDSNKLKIGSIPFIGRSSVNNGYQGEYDVEIKKKIKENCITISMVGDPKAFYQPYEFTCSQNILILRNDKVLNKNNSAFLCAIINNYLLKKGYGYGYPVGLNRVRRNSIFIPKDKNDNPNWRFMEDYIKQEQKDIAQKIVSYYEQKMLETTFDLVGLEDVEWRTFKIEDIFDIKPVKGKVISKYSDGNIPYISTSSQINGLIGFIDSNKDFSMGKCISIDPIAGNCFYHDYQFIGRGGAGSAINLLYNENLNNYNAKFVIGSLEKVSKSKASYGLALNGNRLKNTKLILPADQNGNPHWDYMSKFMKKIEVQELEKALEYIYIS